MNMAKAKCGYFSLPLSVHQYNHALESIKLGCINSELTRHSMIENERRKARKKKKQRKKKKERKAAEDLRPTTHIIKESQDQGYIRATISSPQCARFCRTEVLGIAVNGNSP